MKLLTSALLLAFAVTAEAGMFKCTNAQGAVEFSDKPCINAQRVETFSAQDNRISGPPSARGSGNPNLDAVTSQVRIALSKKDIPRAKGLAVTAEHWSMIEVAERQATADQRRKDHHDLIHGILRRKPWNEK